MKQLIPPGGPVALAAGDAFLMARGLGSGPVPINVLDFTEHAANKGANNGYAGLNNVARVPRAQLPWYNVNVLEYNNTGVFPVTGAGGKIYVALDTGLTYTWNGSAYVASTAVANSTDTIVEGAQNVYYTVARSLGTVLTGLNTSLTGAVVATDTMLVAFGKLQRAVTAIGSGVSDGDKGDVVVSSSGAVWSLDYAAVNPVIAPVFTNITSKPTTLSGYGIADGITAAAVAAGYQPLDSDLTTIAAIVPSNDRIMQVKGGVWAQRTPTQVATDLNSLIAPVFANITSKPTTLSGYTISDTKANFNTACSDGDFLYTGDVLAFTTIQVSGQADVVADSVADTVTLVAGSGIAITTNAGTDTITIAATGGGSTEYFGQLQADYALTNSTSLQQLFNWSAGGALSLPVGIYKFKIGFAVNAMSATTGNLSFDLKGAGTGVFGKLNYFTYGSESTTAFGSTVARGGTATNVVGSASTIVLGSTLVSMNAVIEGMFEITTTGTIIPSVALNTAAAAVVQAGAFFHATRISTTANTLGGTWT